MATIETICKFNQSGFCKFLSQCRKQHVMEICPTNQCNIKTCLLRHPKMCKYFSNSGSCKFNFQCAYLHHHTKNTVDVEISELESKIKEMESKIQEIEILQLKLDQHETQLKLLDSDNQKQNEQHETKLEDLAQKVKEVSENF